MRQSTRRFPEFEMKLACEASVLTRIYWNTCQVKVLKWPISHFGGCNSEQMNMLCVYMSAITAPPPLCPLLLLDWTVYSFPGSMALKLHHCKGPAFMQLSRPLERARASVLWDVCKHLTAVASAWDPLWLEGWTYSDNKKLSLHLFFLFPFFYKAHTP